MPKIKRNPKALVSYIHIKVFLLTFRHKKKKTLFTPRLMSMSDLKEKKRRRRRRRRRS